jgi:anti-anti-sigma regulatory factor
MLKISFIEGLTQCQLVLEGKLIAPWAAELRSACESARADLRGRELVIDMKHITTISQEGENVLHQLVDEGFKFRCRDVFTKHVVKQLSRATRQKIQEAK